MGKKTITIATTFIIIIIIIVGYLYITSQGQDDTRKFEGAWKGKIQNFQMIYHFFNDVSGKNIVIYGFDGNGNLEYNVGGKYTVTGGKLVITQYLDQYTPSGSPPVYQDYKFSNNSNSLTLSSNDGVGFNITLDKLASFNLSDYLNIPEPQRGVKFTPMWWRYEAPYAKLDFRLSNITQPSWIQLPPEDLDELNISIQYNGVTYPYTFEYNYKVGVEQYELQADIGTNASGRVVFTISYVYGKYSGTEQQILDI